MRVLFLALCLSILLISCKKEKGEQVEKKEETWLKACNCADTSIEFIKAEFSGIEMCFDNKYNSADLSSNVHIYNEATRTDQLKLIRYNNDFSLTVAFFISNTRFYKKPLPYTLHPYKVIDVGEGAEFQLTFPLASGCQFCPTDSTNYVGNAYNSFNVSITDTTDGYIKGNFSGMIKTKANNRMIEVRNGTFNLKIKRVSQL